MGGGLYNLLPQKTGGFYRLCPEIPSLFIKEVLDIEYYDYVEDAIHDYADGDCPNNDTGDTFNIYSNTSDLSSQSLAICMGFAEEVADAETEERKVEQELNNTSENRHNSKNIDMVSLKSREESKINLYQRDPHFLDYVKQVCNGGDISSHVNTSWENIF